jgi:penicillin-binding protein 2
VAMATAALETGFNPNTRYYCPGHMEFGNHRFHCWKAQGHGYQDLHGAIVNSCDVYFYRLSQKLGIEPMNAISRKLGLGDKVGIDLPNEKGGLMPNPEWKKRRFKQPWTAVETLIASIGQGYMLATPLQLAVMTARIVNGGRAVVPHVMESIKGKRRAQMEFPPMGINPQNLAFVARAMADVCQPGGTAYGARIPAVGYEMGGKTGTSQVRRISRAERAKGVIPNEKRPWEDRDHALFIGFAPTVSPRYVVSVVVEHGGGGGKVAAPIARDLLIHTQRIDPAKILPKPLDILPPDEQKALDAQKLLQEAPPETETPDAPPQQDDIDNVMPAEDMQDAPNRAIPEPPDLD